MTIIEKENHILSLQEQISKVTDEKAKGKLQKDLLNYTNQLGETLTAWDRVLLARHPKRPTSLDYIEFLFNDFIEIHGDRCFSDDKAIITGLASINGFPITVIAEQKGKNTKDSIYRNFGMPQPDGYRKAVRAMKQAEKFNRPIVTFIDTPGAYPGIEAEERGQGEAIATSLLEMSKLTVPVISFVIGEGSSGGALAIGIANRVSMLANSVYSILSPEGYASILWKDASKCIEAAEIMKLTAFDLKSNDLIDEVINEPNMGAHNDFKATANNLKESLINFLNEYSLKTRKAIKEERYNKFRNIGFFQRFNYDNL